MFVVEFIDTPDMLQGPRAAMCDAFGLVNAMSVQLGMATPAVAWQDWTLRAGMGGAPAEGDLFQPLPDACVFSGWTADSGARLAALSQRDRGAAERLRQVHAARKPVVAFHTGVAMLAQAGLLKGREATVPWAYLGAMLSLEPRLHLATQQAWRESGGVWTVAGPASATEVAFELLAAGGVGDLAHAVREVLLPGEDRQRAVANLSRRVKPHKPVGQIERARRYIEEHFQETVELEAVAEAASMSVRTLLRQFRQHFGVTPVQMVHRLRLATARMLLQATHHQIDHVSQQCGWKSAAMMRRVFKEDTGMTPDEYRKRFGLMPARTVQGRS